MSPGKEPPDLSQRRDGHHRVSHPVGSPNQQPADAVAFQKRFHLDSLPKACNSSSRRPFPTNSNETPGDQHPKGRWMQGRRRQVFGVLFGGDGRVHPRLPAAFLDGAQLPGGVAMVVAEGKRPDQFHALPSQGVEELVRVGKPGEGQGSASCQGCLHCFSQGRPAGNRLDGLG